MTAEEQDNWENVHYRMSAEGFDYCFRQYSEFEEIEDQTFHELRMKYEEAANQLENYIEEKFREAIDNDYKD